MKDEFHIVFEGKTLKELLIFAIEKNFDMYLKIIKYIKLTEINFGVFNMHQSSDLPLKLDKSENEIYNLLYRQPFDRSN